MLDDGRRRRLLDEVDTLLFLWALALDALESPASSPGGLGTSVPKALETTTCPAPGWPCENVSTGDQRTANAVTGRGPLGPGTGAAAS